MKIRTVSSDGSVQDGAFVFEVMDKDGTSYDPSCLVTCRPILGKERREIEKESERWVNGPRGKGKQREVDNDAAAELVVIRAVISWEGIDGSDDKPLPCNASTKTHLPPHVKAQIIARVLDTEDTASVHSFRESPDMVRVVG